ncbi:MAG: cytochrome P450 [Nocardioidaceae bacterium]|nr:cytochrome P450 [Nocardioidaceae bacterium]MCL2615075.1 cytochrome P450 [Nocardioidaceae bacterium]
MTQATYVFDPFAPGYADDPYPEYARLRADGRVHEHPLGFWVVSHHEEVSALLRGPLSVERRHMEGEMAERDTELFGERATRRLSMLHRDPPGHTRLRKLVSKAFTPRSIAALEPEIVQMVDGLLDDMSASPSGTADLLEALAFPLPFAVISQMMGIPPGDDHTRMRELTGLAVRSLEPVVDPDVATQILAAGQELAALCSDVVARKRREPGDDLLTALIQAEDDGDVLGDEELVAQVVLLYVAGHETTVNLIANGTLALLRNPDQLALLRSTPDLADNAVEELLRYDSPVQFSRRITLEPYDVAGQTIPAGSFVMASLASANRDEEHWGPDADRLRLDRPDARSHLSFGSGVHHCLGAALARLEGRIVFQRLVARFPDLALAGDIEWNGRINLRGPVGLPVSMG